ncbi:hypothetical protein [Microbulbifer sp. SSSA008]|uniref:hypothetical protein n=1 Tax=unclassified Microbulbifer TaxID=2619833 RepID=UPI004039A74E
MKKQFLYIWCGIATWYVAQGLLSFIAFELQIDKYPGLTYGVLALINGFIGGSVVLALSKENNVLIQSIPLIVLSLAWIVLSPAPHWRNFFTWNWPIWGVVSMLLTIYFGQKYLTKSSSKDAASGAA